MTSSRPDPPPTPSLESDRSGPSGTARLDPRLLRRAVIALLCGVTAGVGVQFLAWRLGGWPVLDGSFTGPDAYMRMNRVLECRGGEGCPGGLYPRSNAPFGEVLHWPFLMDWLILGLAAPFRLFLADDRAIETTGYLLGPLLQVGAVAAVLFATRPLVRGRAWMAAGMVLACQLWVVLAFAPSRPDHHGIQALLFLGAVAGVIHLLCRDPSGASRPFSWIEAATALCLAGALWVSVEGVVTVTLPLAALALRWIADGGRPWARVNARVHAGLAGVLVLALLVDPPQAGAQAVVYDRLSLVYVLPSLAVAGFWWWLATRAPPPTPETRGRRLMLGLGATAAIALGTALIFPGAVRGPLAEVDPRIVPLWLDFVAEYVPLRSSSGRAVVAGLGPLLVAAPVAAWAWLRARGPERWGWGLVGGALIWSALLALLHGSRWVYYGHLLVPLPLCWLLGRALSALRAAPSPLTRAGGEVGAVVAAALAIPVLALVLDARIAPAPASGDAATAPEWRRGSCPADPLVAALAPIPPRWPGEAVLATIWWGPQILYQTRFDVVATPYHRNHDGILASRDILASDDDGDIRRRLEARGIGYLTLCRGDGWIPALGPASDRSLWGRLEAGSPPPFLTPVPLPDGLDAHYALWRFDPTEGPGRPPPQPEAAR